ncbi:MAG: DUF2333 family protein [Chloroflexi bacterium]|nr:DUF2333 family protein [Chloroflexota bacterium]
MTTELSPLATVLHPEDHLHAEGSEFAARLKSAGVPVSTAEVKVMTEDNEEVPLGEVGEICVRAPMVMNGGGYGLFANHSLVMANYLARANAGIINLRELLDQG